MSTVPNPAIPQASDSQPTASPATSAHSFPLADFKAPANLWRIGVLACGLIILLCFFLPQFYASLNIKDLDIPNEMRAEYHRSWLVFGWNTWWGWLSFIFTGLATVIVAADLLLASSVKEIRTYARFLYPALFAFLSLITGLGFLLALLGIDLHAAKHLPGGGGPSLSDYSLFRFPIMAIPLVLFTVIALGISATLLFKELKKSPAASAPSPTPPS